MSAAAGGAVGIAGVVAGLLVAARLRERRQAKPEGPPGFELAQVYKLTCTKCGDSEPFSSSEYGGYLVVDTVEEGHESVKEMEGRVLEDGSIVCRACLDEEEFWAEEKAEPPEPPKPGGLRTVE